MVSDRDKRDLFNFSRTAAMFRLQGFIAYAQFWEQECDKIYNLNFIQDEDELFAIAEEGQVQARKDFDKARGIK